jgi:hypothetical protein
MSIGYTWLTTSRKLAESRGIDSPAFVIPRNMKDKSEI